MSDTLDQLLAAAIEPWLDAHTRRGAVVEAMRAELAAAGYVIVKRDAPPDTLAAAIPSVADLMDALRAVFDLLGCDHMDRLGVEVDPSCPRCQSYPSAEKLRAIRAACRALVRPADTRTEAGQ